MIPSSARSRALITSAATLALVAVSFPASAEVPDADRRSAPSGSPVSAGLPFSWQTADTGTLGNFVALDVVSEDVAWATTSDTAEVMLTTDGGATFTNVAPPEGIADGLQFYDVEATSADEAIVLSSGTGELSRVYHTPDGGETWHETFRAVDDLAFFNCVAMFDDMRGYAVGDPINDKYQIITTGDGGMSWDYVDPANIPDAQPGEFEWAASGTCANATGKKGFFGTGAATESRVIRTLDYGQTWEMAVTDIPAGASGGIFGVDFRTNKLGLAIGGDASTLTGGLARTTDGGVTWESVAGPGEFRTGIAWWADKKGSAREIRKLGMDPTEAQKTVFAVGVTGSNVSTDRGRTWTFFDPIGLNTVDCLEGSSVCMAAGGGGVFATLAVG